MAQIMKRYSNFLTALLTVLGMTAQSNIPAIDIHSHVVTDEYLKYLEDNKALMADGYPLPAWDENSHLAFMDSVGIERSVLTLSSPQPWFGNLEESRKVIRSVNERMAEAKHNHPDRFLWCAALPQPDIEASINEAVYALDTLGADGVKLATSVDGVYLGDSVYDPLMKALDDRSAVVILHPVKPNPVNESTFTGDPIFVYEYPAETTRAVLNMVAHNVMTRYPNIKVVVPHAGSFMPYAVPRLKGGYPLLLKQGLTEPIDIDGNLSKLYYDLAGGPSVQAVKMLLTVTTPDHIMFGTDYPFVSAPILEKVAAKVKHDISQDAELGQYADDIIRNNAMKLFKIPQIISKMPTTHNMIEKLPMQDDGIVRLSKIQVNPDYIDEYMQYAMEVGTISLETEPGVLTMYAVADKDNPCNITILETYASQDAYKSHIASEHFQKYKQGTLHMVDSLKLDDVTPLNPENQIVNYIKHRP